MTNKFKAEILKELKCNNRNQYVAALVMNIIVFCHGSTAGWVSPMQPLLESPESPLVKPLTPWDSALVGSILCMGAVFTTPLYGWIADAHGRKTAAIVSAFPYLICWILKCFWRTTWGLVLARFLAGVGASGMFMLAPLYASEIGSLETRGALSSLAIFTMNFGTVFMFTLGSYTSYNTVLAVMIPQPILFILLMLKMPETPAFLVKKNRLEEAAKAISWLRSVPMDSGIVRKEVEFLKCEMDLANNSNKKQKLYSSINLTDERNDISCLEEKSSWKIIMTSRPTLRAFLTLLALMTIQSFTGMYVVVTYCTGIFIQAGSSVSPAAASIIVGLVQLVGSLGASSLIEKLGRKILMISSFLSVAVSLAAMAAFSVLRDHHMSDGLGWIPLVAMSVAVCTFALGAGPVPYVLPSEIFLVQVRGIVTSVLLTWVWLISYIIAQFFGTAMTIVGMTGVFCFFSMVACLGAFVTIFCLPETKGRTMDEILSYFSGRKPSIPMMNIQIEKQQVL